MPEAISPAIDRDGITVYLGDCRDILPHIPDASVHCCVTSPPYWGLRDYGHEDQIGLEKTPEEYVAKLVAVFREVRRVLRDDGTLWLNLGDSYATGGGAVGRCPGGGEQGERFLRQGHINTQPNRMPLPGLKPKDLVGIPWAVAFALRADGWYLRQDIIWHKPSPMPESVQDRCTKAHEYIFLLSKSKNYHYDAAAIAEPCVESNDTRPRMGQGPNTQYAQKRASWNGSTFTNGKTAKHQLDRAQSEESRLTCGKYSKADKNSAGHRITENVAKARANGADHDSPFGSTRNKRSVWTVATKPFKDAHFAVFPQELITPCILAGCPEGGTVLDPFGGSGTTALVAQRNGCKAILCELNEEYVKMQQSRLKQRSLLIG